MSELKYKIGDIVWFTEDGWSSQYKGVIKNSWGSSYTTYTVYGSKYGTVRCSEMQIKPYSKQVKAR